MDTNIMRIGTLVGGSDAVRVIPQIVKHGFESFNLTFGKPRGHRSEGACCTSERAGG